MSSYAGEQKSVSRIIEPMAASADPVIPNLLIADFVSDVGAFMQAVGAAWLMTSRSSSPLRQLRHFLSSFSRYQPGPSETSSTAAS